MSKGPGRPAHEPTKQQREAVQVMAAAGVTHDAIAAIVGISDETLRKHYGEELRHGNSRIVSAVAGALVKRALGNGPDAVNAQKFFLERRGGMEWREKRNVDVTLNSTAEALEKARRRAADHALREPDDQRPN